jgi:hypothetical protein
MLVGVHYSPDSDLALRNLLVTNGRDGDKYLVKVAGTNVGR